ncbi:MAG: hypothetical protein GKR90_15480 [Pseudomonadales bacterium]|nr:hypothetical protein [Pseudomonadales bacterium]
MDGLRTAGAWMRYVLWFAALCGASLAHAEEAQSDELFKVRDTVPPGFEAFAEKQETQADIYYGGIFLLSTFVTYDLMEVELGDPVAVVEAVPNVKNPEKLTESLSGPLANNASVRCSSRVISDCGKLEPEVSGVIFDDSTYRLDLFVSQHELLVHELEQDKYLPPPGVDRSTLHNLRLNMSGVGDRRSFNIGSESYLSWRNSRLRGRFGVADGDPALYELSWQRDDPDVEYEIGSFRSSSRELAFVGDNAVLGARVSTSTKTRTDLLQATATPVLIFLDERSQINVYRGSELIDSSFMDAGNHELDTRNYPSGAYDISIQTVGLSGVRDVQTHFFVRSHNFPPMGEPQYFVEVGARMLQEQSSLPSVGGGAWLRGGASHRLSQTMSLDTELLYAGDRTIAQVGSFFLTKKMQLYAGLMASTGGDLGQLLRASYFHRDVSAHFDLRHVKTENDLQAFDEFRLLRRSYLQGSASIGFPLGSGRMFVRGTLSEQSSRKVQGFGVSYLGPLFQKWGFRADIRIDSHYAKDESWIKAGVTFRRIQGSDSTIFGPSVRSSNGANGSDLEGNFNGYWNGMHEWDRIGKFQRSSYLNHDGDRSSLGTRLMPENFPGSDLELGVQRRQNRNAELFYAMNNTMSVVRTKNRTTIGDGGSTAGAVVVHVKGPVEGQFEVRVNNRVAGYAWANRANVISLRPYETYQIKLNAISDNIVGFDESEHEITIFPGNVEVLEFAAYELTVLVGQAVDEQGHPLALARFQNSVGLGLTDASGWFQIEVKNLDPLILRRKDGHICMLELPEIRVEQSLAMVDTLTCVTIPEPQSAAG